MKIKVDCSLIPDDLIALSAERLVVEEQTINERLTKPGPKQTTKRGSNQHRPKTEIGRPITQMQEAASRGVSDRSLRRMKFVERKGIPALTQAITDGSIKVSKAEEIATLPQDQQQEALELHLEHRNERAKDPRKITAKEWSLDVFPGTWTKCARTYCKKSTTIPKSPQP
jgi:hypothetical protein